jgi:hypothetical protein
MRLKASISSTTLVSFIYSIYSFGLNAHKILVARQFQVSITMFLHDISRGWTLNKPRGEILGLFTWSGRERPSSVPTTMTESLRIPLIPTTQLENCIIIYKRRFRAEELIRRKWKHRVPWFMRRQTIDRYWPLIRPRRWNHVSSYVSIHCFLDLKHKVMWFLPHIMIITNIVKVSAIVSPSSRWSKQFTGTRVRFIKMCTFRGCDFQHIYLNNQLSKCHDFICVRTVSISYIAPRYL